MSMQNRHETVGRLVAEVPARARVFERIGINYCCGGARTLDEVAREHGLDLDALVREVDAVEAAPGPGADWLSSDEALIAHALWAHHAYLHAELPALQALVQSVVRAHGANHPELATVECEFAALVVDLSVHMQKEEQVLFPLMELVARGEVHAAHCSGIRAPLLAMRREHVRTVDVLARIRKLTCNYAAPPDACASYTAMLARLERLERDTLVHLDEEENVLFERVLSRGRLPTPQPRST